MKSYSDDAITRNEVQEAANTAARQAAALVDIKQDRRIKRLELAGKCLIAVQVIQTIALIYLVL